MRASYFARRWIVQVSLGFTSQIQLARPSQARPIPQVRTLPCPPPRRATTENQLNEPPNPARVLLAAHVRLHDVVARSAPARAIPYSRPLERRAPRSRHRRRLGGQPEVREDRHDHLALGNVADDRSVTATIAGQNVHPIDSSEHLRPPQPRTPRPHGAVPPARSRAARRSVLARAATLARRPFHARSPRRCVVGRRRRPFLFLLLGAR